MTASSPERATSLVDARAVADDVRRARAAAVAAADDRDRHAARPRSRAASQRVNGVLPVPPTRTLPMLTVRTAAARLRSTPTP